MAREETLNTIAIAAFTVFAAGCGDDKADAEQTGRADGDTQADTGTVDPLITDDDLDGVTESGGDCNDRNDGVFPGARERSFDQVDSDCDGEDMPSTGEDRYAEALPLLDTDGDGAVSFEEFDAACATAAMVTGEANPGVVQTHSDCGGTNGCRGMILHPWNELYEHDCRGVNGCTGWSCVETADGEDRDGPTAFAEANCDYCHSGAGGAFLVQVPTGEDAAEWVEGFSGRPDEEFRSAIAFGLSGISSGGVAYADMPAHYEVLSRGEMDTLIAYVRTLPLEAPSE